MRKITLNPRFGSNGLNYVDFENTWIIVKSADNVEEFKAGRYQFQFSNYTVEQIKAIFEVNNVLKQNNQPLMTNGEIEHLLYPFGKEQKVATEDLQALAGFRVEKTIIPL
jgi:hypothetical protein